MLEWLLNFDTVLYLMINVGLANPVTDVIMPVVTSDSGLRGSYALAMVLLLWKGNARLRWLVLASAITLTFSDQLSSHLLKPMIERLRPCHLFQHEYINLLVPCGGGWSMPSSHAANAFGQALLFGSLYHRTRPYLFWLALLIGVSRVFVGVHYPGDVLAGAFVGGTIGLVMAWLFGQLPLKTSAGQDSTDEPDNAPDN